MYIFQSYFINMKFSKKGIYGVRYPESLCGDFYLKKRGNLSFKERFVIRVLNSYLGWHTMDWLMHQHPDFFIHRLEQALKPFSNMDIDKSLEDVQKLKNFEDLMGLYCSITVNRKAIQLDLDEAVYVFSLVRSLRNCRILEIGRYRGGSAVLFAVAMDDNSKLTSVDNLTKIGCDDQALKNVLKRFGLSHKVELIVQDSTSVKTEPNSYDLIFIDGDHTYEGVMKDYEHWKYAVKPGGHLLFHDAVYGRRFASVNNGPAFCVEDIQKNDYRQFKKVKEIGSIVHFSRTDNPW